jgi:hypothetical protein
MQDRHSTTVAQRSQDPERTARYQREGMPGRRLDGYGTR